MSFSEMCQNFNNNASVTVQNIARNVAVAVENVKTQGQLLGRKIDAACVNHLGAEKTEMIYRIFKNLPLALAIFLAPPDYTAQLSCCFLGAIYLVDKDDRQRDKKMALKITSLLGTYFALSAADVGLQLLQSHPAANFSSMLWRAAFSAWSLSRSIEIKRGIRGIA